MIGDLYKWSVEEALRVIIALAILGVGRNEKAISSLGFAFGSRTAICMHPIFALRSDRDDTHLNKTGRYQMANKKEEVISS